jgi:nitrate reductase NapD|tara:strand:+ start:4703 stop:4957 length:255 start_codon:yes stop_codon:yes gene_type:complete
MVEEVHISSLVVHALPESLETITKAINQSPVTSVEIADSSGKLVVLLETAHQKAILDEMDKIQQLAGVINTSLIYHHIDQNEPA